MRPLPFKIKPVKKLPKMLKIVKISVIEHLFE